MSVHDGGILALSNIQANGSLGSIQPGSLLDITGTGLVTLPGDFTAVVDGYIAAGRIAGNGVPGLAEAVYDGNLDKTLIIAVPEPSTFALITLMGFGWAARRWVRRG